MPSPLPSSTPRRVSKPSPTKFCSLITRSARPSPLTSPTATDVGPKLPSLAAKRWAGPNVPSPWPSSTLTALLAKSADTRSGRPSPLKSWTATAHGCEPTARSIRGRKEPSPLPSSRLTASLPLFAVTRSRAPLPSKSPTATAAGPWPTPMTRWSFWNEPSPLPSSTSTTLFPECAMARSSRPSLLTSPTATALAPGRRLVVTAGRKAAVAVPQEHADTTRQIGKLTLVQDHDVLLAVGVEVLRLHGLRPQTYR